MTDQQSITLKTSENMGTNPASIQTIEADLSNLFDSIENLRSYLYRFIPHDTTSVDVSVLTRLGLKTVHNEFNRHSPFLPTWNNQELLQKRAKEGRKIGRF